MIDEEGRALTFGEIGKELGARWSKLNPRQKGVWETRAEKEKLQLKRRQAAREQQAADLRKGQGRERHQHDRHHDVASSAYRLARRPFES